jgi:hypothetical protein
MTAPAAIQGDYAGLRFVNGRKVCQVIIEIPIEAGAAFVAAFGTPDPSKTIPVALARIDPSVKPEKKGGKLAQRAGILCSEGAFIMFLVEHIFKKKIEECDPVDPVALLRSYCEVNSRAQLDHDEAAARKFLDLEASYKAWLTVAA